MADEYGDFKAMIAPSYPFRYSRGECPRCGLDINRFGRYCCERHAAVEQDRMFYELKKEMQYFLRREMEYVFMRFMQEKPAYALPEKKPMKLTALALRVLDSETRALVKAGFLNADLSLTAEGKEALLSHYLVANKKELAREARKRIASKRQKQGEDEE